MAEQIASRGTEVRDGDLDDAVDQALVASRALVGVAARSLAAIESEITLRQYRALVLLASRGDQNVSGLAEALEIHPSTATRLCDRLLKKRLIERRTSPESRREVTVAITPQGRTVVRVVTNRRRKEIRRILQQLEPDDRGLVVAAFATFTRAAGEVPDEAWKLGWTTA